MEQVPDNESAVRQHQDTVHGSPSGMLADAREQVLPALRATVDTIPASIRPICEYHLGWRDATGGIDNAGVGKGIRAALVLGCARAAGGRASDAVPAAVAVELIHNASLLHDDVIDGDAVRRHRATVWSAFGMPAAILAGDALFFLAIRVLAASPAAWASDATLHLVRATERLIDGEYTDTVFEAAPSVPLAQCLTMSQAKTAALMECACLLGGLAGGADPDRTLLWSQFGAHLGVAFQLVDDLLGIWGDPAATGKPAGSDLRRRKKSLPVVAALVSETAAGRELARVYAANSRFDEADLARAAALIEDTGAREWARQEADHQLRRAAACLRATDPAPLAAADLTGLLELLANRTR
ncbi:polyprenyl synthetase family protein [Nocardia sp. NBC_00881]|uniref:polyprenyl synthetase family protein n=1 Tax=Nocardia sp. NBC_00881 TaxID=2975995 RepID=UPI0038669A3D|nr:polyprenyl synthetase family protein [Nocardia sp. NBC_00881]